MDVYHEIIPVNLDLDVQFYLAFDKGKRVAPHWHDNIEIVYLLEGRSDFRIEEKVISVKKGDIYIVNSNVIHSVVCGYNKTLVLQVPTSILAKYVGNYEDLYFKVSKKNTNINNIKQLFLRMYRIYRNKNEGYLFRFNSLLYELLYQLIEYNSIHLVEKEQIQNNKIINKVKDIMLYINKNHAQNITIKKIAFVFGYNVDYISRFFKKYVKMTILQYLYEIRITYVYRDLLKTDLLIHDILEKHGCFNYKVAMKFFKLKYDCTPREIRNSKKSMSE